MAKAFATQQPQQGAQIFGGSPLAAGLVFATTGAPGTGFIDFVSGRLPTITGATSGIDTNGVYAKPAASSGQINWPAGSTGLDQLSGVGTLLICMRSNNNAGNWRAFGSREDSSTGDGVYLLYDDNANVTNGFNAGANNNNYRANSNSNALGTNSEQSFHTYGFSWDGAGCTTWADGKLDKTTTGGLAAFSANANTGRVTRIASGTNAADFIFAYAWNRVLSATEIASITRNPWQIFVARRAAIVVAAGGNTVAAGSGHLTLTGKQPAVNQTTTLALAPGTGHLVLTGKQPSIAQGANASVSAGVGHLTFTGYTPSVNRTQNQAAAAGTGHLSFTGKQPSVAQTANQAVAPAAGHLTFTGKQPSVTQSVVTSVAPGAGHLTLAGKQPAIVQTANQAVAPGTGHVLFTGYSPVITGPVVEQATNYYGKGKGLSREEVEAQWELLELRQKSAPKPIDQPQQESIVREKSAPAPVTDVAALSGPAPSIEVPDGLLQMPVVIAPHVDTVSELTHRLTTPAVKKPKPIKIKPVEIAAANDEDDEAALLAILEVI